MAAGGLNRLPADSAHVADCAHCLSALAPTPGGPAGGAPRVRAHHPEGCLRHGLYDRLNKPATASFTDVLREGRHRLVMVPSVVLFFFYLGIASKVLGFFACYPVNVSTEAPALSNCMSPFPLHPVTPTCNKAISCKLLPGPFGVFGDAWLGGLSLACCGESDRNVAVAAVVCQGHVGC